MRKHLLYWVFFTQTFLKRHTKQIAFAALTGFLATLFIFQVYPYLSMRLERKHLRIGIIGNYKVSNLPLSIQNKISFGLTAILPNGEATEAASLSYTVENRLIYKFKLKPNLKWHDGKQLTAHDINYRIQGAELKALDNYTLEIKLKDPYAPLPIILSQPLFREKLNGLGLYKVVRLTKIPGSDQISDLTIVPQLRDLPSETYRFYSARKNAILAFKLGEIDILEDMDTIEELKDWKNLEISEKTLYNQVITLFYNLKKTEFKEKEVRQAFAYAIAPVGIYEKAASPISPFSWAYSQKIRLYQYDEETARKILSKSPLATSSANLVLTAPVNMLSLAQHLIDAWAKVGVPVKIKVDNGIPGDYQFLLRTLPIPPDPDQYYLWQSTAENTNLSNYSSAKIDKLLEDGRKTLDTEERKKIYADFQFYLVDDAPAIFLYYPKSYQVTRK